MRANNIRCSPFPRSSFALFPLYPRGPATRYASRSFSLHDSASALHLFCVWCPALSVWWSLFFDLGSALRVLQLEIRVRGPAVDGGRWSLSWAYCWRWRAYAYPVPASQMSTSSARPPSAHARVFNGPEAPLLRVLCSRSPNLSFASTLLSSLFPWQRVRTHAVIRVVVVSSSSS